MVYIIIGVVVSVLAIILGIISGKHVFDSACVIGIRISKKRWVMPVVQSVLGVTICMVVELFVSNIIKSTIGTIDNYGLWLLDLAVENGVLIVILLPMVFYFFDKAIKEERLDAFDDYNPNVVKICVSVLIWFICFGLFFKLKGEYLKVKADEISTFYFNRIVMWAIAPLGGFIEFSDKQKQKKVDTCKRKIKWKEIISSICSFAKKWGATVISLAFAAGIITISLWAEKVAFIAVRYILLGIIIYAVVVLIMKSIMMPSRDRSEKVFDRIKEDDKKKHRFGRMKYNYSNKTLTIDRVNIEYKDHEKDSEFLKLFDTYTKEDYEKKEALEFLRVRFDEQKDYIRKAYAKCDELMLSDEGNKG